MKSTRVPPLHQPECPQAKGEASTARQPYRRDSFVALLGICLLALAIPGNILAQEEEAGPLPGAEEAEIMIEAEDAPFMAEFEPFDDELEPATHPAPNGSQQDSQTLHFASGHLLHGSLAGIDSQQRELLWRRTDASAPIPFSLGEITSLSLAANPNTTAPSGKITVKLTGNDWFTADGVAMKDGKLQIRLGESSPLLIDRDRVEWIYFAKTTAPECYDGPTSMAGWISDGSWTFRDGALHALRPGMIGRHFDALPDLVEYFFEVDQHGGYQAFSVNLRGIQIPGRGFAQGRLQIMFSANDLRLWAQVGEEMKMEQVDLRKALGDPADPNGYRPPRNRAIQYRILEDFPGGRLFVFIDGRKAAEWKVGKGEAGKNRGGFAFQPMVWNPDTQQSIPHLRVLPWDGIVPTDGPLPDDRDDADSVVLAGGGKKKGEILELGASKLKLRTADNSTELPREQIRLLRFRRPEVPPDEDVPVARVRLARRGEFDVIGMGVQNGLLSTRTSFGGEVAFPLGAIRTVEFSGATAPAEPASDVLVFKNGDRLQGTLEGIATGAPIRWRANGGKLAVEIQPGNVLGVQLARKAEAAEAHSGVLARFRNGDLLSGEFVGLDAERLLLKTPHNGPLGIARDHLRALYFANGGPPPVLDGSMDSELWMNGEELRRATEKIRGRPVRQNPARPTAAGPWRYFDGTFTYQRPDRHSGHFYRGSTYLGRLFEEMPQSVEISFHVAGTKIAPTFSAQLFSEPNNPGYMMQCYSEGIFLHDMSPRGRGRAVFQQQFSYDGKIPINRPQRHVRILADRPSGRVTFIVDGVVIGQILRKPSEGERNLGRGFMLLPQSHAACTFSDLWVGPWNGLVPGQEPAGVQKNEHSVLLANGDETRGKAVEASATTMDFESEVGPVELPVARLTMLDLGTTPTQPEQGIRLRLVGRGALTVTNCRIENGTVTCQSPVAGELHLPLSALREIALASPAPESGKQKRMGGSE